MKLRELILNEEVDEGLINHLKKFFVVYTRQGKTATRELFIGDLTSKEGAVINRFPANIEDMVGALTFTDCQLKNLNGIPLNITKLALINPGPDFQLSSDLPVSIHTLELENISHITDLTSGNNIVARFVSFNDMTNLTSLAGIESMHATAVSLFNVPKLVDDLSKYKNCQFSFYQIPPQLPLVNLIAYAGHSVYAELSLLSRIAIDRDYRDIKNYIGQGARAVMPLIRYFQSQGQPYRHADVKAPSS